MKDNFVALIISWFGWYFARLQNLMTGMSWPMRLPTDGQPEIKFSWNFRWQTIAMRTPTHDPYESRVYIAFQLHPRFFWWCLLQSTYIWSLNQIKPARTTHGVAQVVKVYLNVHAQRAQREAVYCPLPTSIVHIQTLVTPQRLSRCTIFKQFNQ